MGARATAAAYIASEAYPFARFESARPRSDSRPFARSSVTSSAVYDNAAASETTPNDATGNAARGWFLIHSVTTGASDSQNSSVMLAHITDPLIRRAARRRWWWLFQ